MAKVLILLIQSSYNVNSKRKIIKWVVRVDAKLIQAIMCSQTINLVQTDF